MSVFDMPIIPNSVIYIMLLRVYSPVYGTHIQQAYNAHNDGINIVLWTTTIIVYLL